MSTKKPAPKKRVRKKPSKPASERGSVEPVPGRCGAKRRKSDPARYCKAYPLKTKTRCKVHGGAQEKVKRDPLGFWQNFDHLTEADQDLLALALADPNLLDTKRPVALATVLAQRFPMIPTEQQIRTTAMYLNGKQAADLSAADIAEAQAKLATASVRIIDTLGRRQDSAVKLAKTSEVLVGQVMPVLDQLGKAVADLVATHVAPEKQTKFIDDLQGRFRAAITQMVGIAESG